MISTETALVRIAGATISDRTANGLASGFMVSAFRVPQQHASFGECVARLSPRSRRAPAVPFETNPTVRLELDPLRLEQLPLDQSPAGDRSAHADPPTRIQYAVPG